MSELSRPTKGHKGKTWCAACGEQVVFMWKDKPRYCAMCGIEFEWVDERSPAEQLRAAIEQASNGGCMLVKIDADVAKRILTLLDTDEGRSLMQNQAEEVANEKLVIPEVCY